MSQHSRFSDDPGFTTVTACITCKHAHPDGVICKAFPKGIPAEILSGWNDHTRAVAGDGGLRYAPADPRS